MTVVSLDLSVGYAFSGVGTIQVQQYIDGSVRNKRR